MGVGIMTETIYAISRNPYGRRDPTITDTSDEESSRREDNGGGASCIVCCMSESNDE